MYLQGGECTPLREIPNGEVRPRCDDGSISWFQQSNFPLYFLLTGIYKGCLNGIISVLHYY